MDLLRRGVIPAGTLGGLKARLLLSLLLRAHAGRDDVAAASHAHGDRPFEHVEALALVQMAVHWAGAAAGRRPRLADQDRRVVGGQEAAAEAQGGGLQGGQGVGGAHGAI
jgi:hypothetical protein